MPDYFSVMPGFFFSFFVTFYYFFTTCNFCKSLFTIQGGKVSCFNLFFDCSGGGGCTFIYLFWFLLSLREKGWKLMFFFLFHLTCARRRWRGLVCFGKLFFHYWVGREGGQGFFSFDMLKGNGRGRGLIFFFYKFIMGGEGV
jgi:hypothetical protein